MSSFTLFLIILSSLCQVQPKIFQVRDESELNQAIQRVDPGDVINLVRESGLPKIEFKGLAKIERSGNASHPIHFNGHPNITITPEGLYAVGLLIDADYWILNGHSISSEDRAAWGLKIFGNNHKISNCEFKHDDCLTIFGSFNQISNSKFSNCSNGIIIFAGSDNLVENNKIIHSEIYIEIIRGKGNMLRNISATIDNDGINRSKSPFRIDDLNGVFEGNRIIDNRSDESGDTLSTFTFDSANYKIANNSIMTKYSTPFKLGTLGKKETSIGVIFDENTMEFIEKIDPLPYCISGDSDINFNNTEIRKNNICTNGKLTDILENISDFFKKFSKYTIE